MRTLPSVFWSRAHAPITKASLTDRHQISSTPAALKASACSTKPGTCLAEQVGGNAPGTDQTAMGLPSAPSGIFKGVGPLLPETPAGKTIPVLAVPGPFTPTLSATHSP